MQNIKTYWIGGVLCAESVILGYGRRYLGGLEQHLPHIFVHRIEELSQRLVFGRVKLPHIEGPSLARKDPSEEHDLDHVDKLDFLAYHIFDTVLESDQLRWLTPG